MDVFIIGADCETQTDDNDMKYPTAKSYGFLIVADRDERGN